MAAGGKLRPLLWIAVVPAILSTALVHLLNEKTRTPTTPGAHGPGFRSLLPRFWRLISIVDFPDALLPLRARDLGYGFAGVTVVYVLYDLSYAGRSYPAGRFSDRLGRRRVFGAGMDLADHARLRRVHRPDQRGEPRLGHRRGPPRGAGSALGTHAALSGVGLLVAGVSAGLAWSGTGHLPFLISGAVVAALTAAVLLGGGSLDPDPDPATSGTVTP